MMRDRRAVEAIAALIEVSEALALKGYTSPTTAIQVRSDMIKGFVQRVQSEAEVRRVFADIARDILEIR